jgi:hypothetical protein
MLKNAKLPEVDWKKVKLEFKFSLLQFLHYPAKVEAIDASKISDLEVKAIDRDAVMSVGFDAVFVHGMHLVYVAPLSAFTCCQKLHKEAQVMLSLDVSLNDQIVAGIQGVANHDQMQTCEVAIYAANFGIMVCPAQASIRRVTSK